MIHGATDDVGYKAVDHPHSYSDLHATIWNRVGLDYKKMEYNVFGRITHLVEEGEGPIKEILAWFKMTICGLCGSLSLSCLLCRLARYLLTPG